MKKDNKNLHIVHRTFLHISLGWLLAFIFAIVNWVLASLGMLAIILITFIEPIFKNVEITSNQFEFIFWFFVTLEIWITFNTLNIRNTLPITDRVYRLLIAIVSLTSYLWFYNKFLA